MISIEIKQFFPCPADEIDGYSFTLEGFNKLLQNDRASKKDFILFFIFKREIIEIYTKYKFGVICQKKNKPFERG